MATSRAMLAIDFGASRVGLALAFDDVKISYPLKTLSNDDTLFDQIKTIADENRVNRLIVGLPRNLDGEETNQTAMAREFADMLKAQLKLPVYLVDEAVTSLDAEARLKASGKPYTKADIDSTAAALILDNFLSSYEQTK